MSFPIDKISSIKAHPENYKLLTRVPLTSHELPRVLDDSHYSDETFGLIIDTETTGFSPKEDDITELGYVRFAFSPSAGKITQIIEAESLFNEPKKPISEEITRITGITSNMVKGHRIDPVFIKELLFGASLIIAHNAKFDISMLAEFAQLDEQYLASKPVACSVNDIDWKAKGFTSSAQEVLLLQSGFFYDAHRAMDDCLALAWLLMNSDDALSTLYQKANQNHVHMKAIGAPYDIKDTLKSMGFYWNAEQRYWSIVVPEDQQGVIQESVAGLYNTNIRPMSIDMIEKAQRFLL